LGFGGNTGFRSERVPLLTTLRSNEPDKALFGPPRGGAGRGAIRGTGAVAFSGTFAGDACGAVEFVDGGGVTAGPFVSAGSGIEV